MTIVGTRFDRISQFNRQSRSKAPFVTHVSAMALIVGTGTLIVSSPAEAQRCVIETPMESVLDFCMGFVDAGEIDEIASEASPKSIIDVTASVIARNPVSFGLSGAQFTLRNDDAFDGPALLLSGNHAFVIGVNTTVEAVVSDPDFDTLRTSVLLSGEDNSLEVAGNVLASRGLVTGIDMGSGRGNTVTISDTGLVSVTGAGGPFDPDVVGIKATGTDFSITVEEGGRVEGADLTHTSRINVIEATSSANGQITVAGSVFANGRGATGIRATGGEKAIHVTETGTIGVIGRPELATGVFLSTEGGTLDMQGIIEVSGDSATGVRLENGASAVITGEIRSSGGFSDGILAGTSTARGSEVVLAGSVLSSGADNSAIRFGFGSGYRLELHPSYLIEGNVSAAGNNATLAFGGTGSRAFDLEQLGPSLQYRGFSQIEKIGSSVWTLDGTSANSFVTNVREGRLDVTGTLLGSVSVASGAVLGGIGTLGDVTVANGGIIAPGFDTTGFAGVGLKTFNSLILNDDSILDFNLGSTLLPEDSDRLRVSGALTLNGALQISERPGFGNGIYSLIEYGTLVEDNGLRVDNAPVGYRYTLHSGTGTDSTVNLNVESAAAGTNQFWDGANTTPGNSSFGRGGDGVWNAANTNWTNQDGSENAVWADQFAVFSGEAGIVTVEGEQSFSGMQFLSDGYRIEGDGLLSNLNDTAIVVGSDVTATIASDIGGTGNFLKQDLGTLILSGASSRPWNVGAGQLALNGTVAGTTETLLAVNDGAELAIGATGTASMTANAPVVTLQSGARLVNDGLIELSASGSSNAFAVQGSGSGISIENAHEIRSSHSGIDLNASGTTNPSLIANSGSITAPRIGIQVRNARADSRVENTESGLIEGVGSNAILISGMAEVLNAGLLRLDGSRGVAISANHISNSGEIIVDGDNSNAIRSLTAATVTEIAENDLGQLQISNSGLIETRGAGAFRNDASGFGRNDYGSSAVATYGSGYTVTNTGTIRATGETSSAVTVGASYQPTGPGARIIPTHDNLIDNSGLIEGADNGVVIIGASHTGLEPSLGGFETQVNSVVNQKDGEIIGGLGAAILGTDRATDDEYFGQIATAHANEIIDNAGIIRAGRSGRAIDLGGGDDQVILRAGGQIFGSVDGGTGSNRFEFTGLAGQTGSFDFDTSPVLNFQNLIFSGEADWDFTGDGSGFSGSTNITGGTLNVAGNLGGPVAVETGSTLRGTGELGGLVRIADGGILAPGGVDEIGTLTIGRLSLEQGAQLHYRIGEPGTLDAPGTSDMIAVQSAVSSAQDGPQLYLFDDGGAGIGHYRLMTYVTWDGRPPVIATPELGATLEQGPSVLDLVISGNTPDPDPILGNPNLQYWQDASPIWTSAGTDWRNDGGDRDVVWAGNHGVFNGPGGMIEVEGTQGFRGLQFVSDDYVLGGGGQLQTRPDESELRVLGGETATIATQIVGTGGINKTQDGTLVLTGSNTYTGATTIGAGTLSLREQGDISFSETLGISGGGVFDISEIGGTATQVGALSGMTGARIFLGGKDLIVDSDSRSDITFAGVIEGSGALSKIGTGWLTLTGDNTFTGTTTISGGSLVTLGDGGESGSLAGNVDIEDGILSFNRSNDYVYSGAMTGDGFLIHAGHGETTLTGDSSGFSGAVGLQFGTLNIAEGAVLGGSSMTVQPAATIGGLGKFAGDISLFGRLAPAGDSLGTFSVDGNVTFGQDSVLAIGIAGNGENDAVAVSGTARLAGEVEITAIDPHTSYLDGQSYTILNATDPLEGTFSGSRMINHSAFLTPTLLYNVNDVELTIGVSADFTSVARTQNQRQTSHALNGLEQSGDALVVFNAIAGLNEDQARNAFDLSSGEIHASGQHLINNSLALFNHTLRRQGAIGLGALNAAGVVAAPVSPSLSSRAAITGSAGVEFASASHGGFANAWLAPLGGRGSVDGDGNAAWFNWKSAGIAGGFESSVEMGSGDAFAGIGLGYMRSQGSTTARQSDFDTEGFHIGAYGAWEAGQWNLSGALSYAATRVTSTRNITFSSLNRIAAADYWVHSLGFSGEAAYNIDLASGTKIAPLITFDAGWSGHGGFAETGAGALNLTANSNSWTHFDMGIGLGVSHTVPTSTGRLVVEGRAVFERAFADRAPGQFFGLAGGPVGFDISGPPASRNRVRIGAGLAWNIAPEMILRANYDGVFAKSQREHTGSISLNIRF